MREETTSSELWGEAWHSAASGDSNLIEREGGREGGRKGQRVGEGREGETEKEGVREGG